MNENTLSLHELAARPGSTRTILSLISAGADVNERKGEQAYAPLHIAVINDNVPAARALLANGADVAIVDREGAQPMEIAVWRGASRGMKQILADYGGVEASLIPVKDRPKPDDSIATQLPEWHTVDFWLDAPNEQVLAAISIIPDLNRPMSAYQGTTALHHAVSCHRDRVVIKRMLEMGGDPSVPNHNGNTTLHLYAQRGEDPAVIQDLIQHGADPNARNNLGNTPLHSARQRNPDPNIFQALVVAGSDPNLKNKNGETPSQITFLPPNIRRVQLS